MGVLVSAIRRVVSSLLFLGYVPYVQRVLVSLIVVVVLFLFRYNVDHWFTLAHLPRFLLLVVGFISVASWLCDDATRNFGCAAPRQIVLAVAGGQFLSFMLVTHVWGLNASVLALGFVGYQFFSVVKPWPLYHFEEVTGGFGIVLDDLSAGVMTALLMHGLIALNNYIMPIIS